ncbi:MAG: helix-turn-helix domain-containing protein [Acidimicrobiales bacterium]
MGGQAELATQQAADLLNVSRPYLIDPLETGRLACRRVGNRRRILAEDVLAYKRTDDEHRARILDELSRECQLLNLD